MNRSIAVVGEEREARRPCSIIDILLYGVFVRTISASCHCRVSSAVTATPSLVLLPTSSPCVTHSHDKIRNPQGTVDVCCCHRPGSPYARDGEFASLGVIDGANALAISLCCMKTSTVML